MSVKAKTSDTLCDGMAMVPRTTKSSRHITFHNSLSPTIEDVSIRKKCVDNRAPDVTTLRYSEEKDGTTTTILHSKNYLQYIHLNRTEVEITSCAGRTFWIWRYARSFSLHHTCGMTLATANVLRFCDKNTENGWDLSQQTLVIRWMPL